MTQPSLSGDITDNGVALTEPETTNARPRIRAFTRVGNLLEALTAEDRSRVIGAVVALYDWCPERPGVAQARSA